MSVLLLFLLSLFPLSASADEAARDKALMTAALDVLRDLKTPIVGEMLNYFKKSGTALRWEAGRCNLGAGTTPPDYPASPNTITLGGGLRSKSPYVIAGVLAHEGVHALQFREKDFLAAAGGTDKEVWKAYEREFDYLNKLDKVCIRHIKKSRR